MTKKELNTLAASVTPDRLRALALTAWGTFRLPRRTAVPVEALLQGLTAGTDTGKALEYQQVMGRLREAIIATVQHMPDATYVAGI